MIDYEITKNGKNDYSKVFNGNISVNLLQKIINDTKAVSTQRARAYLLIKLINRSNVQLNSIDIGGIENHTVGGTKNGENGGEFELLVTDFLKNKHRVSPKNTVDIRKYININGKKKAITLGCKSGAGDIGYYNINGDLKLLKENYIIWTPIYYKELSLYNTIVLDKNTFIKTIKELGLLRKKKKTNSFTYKMSLQNINSFRMVDKVMELLNNSMNLLEFCDFYNLTIKV
jgi:hypothetical protein